MQVTLKNFKCHESRKFDLSKGIILLKGQSGKGKSSVLESIIFCLYGTGKKITTHGEKTTEVVICWKNYTIKRSKNPNKFTVCDSKTTYEDTCAQEIIFNIFGKYFSHGGYLSQMNKNSFVSLNAIDKLNFFENLAFGDENITKIKETRKKVSKKMNVDLIEAKAKVCMLEQMQEKDPINPDVKEYNFPIKCRPSDRGIAEKNTDVKIKNENTKLIKNQNELKKTKKELDDYTTLQIRINDIENIINENEKRIADIISEIRGVNYNEQSLEKYERKFLLVKTNNEEYKTLIKNNEEYTSQMNKYKINLSILIKKLKDLKDSEKAYDPNDPITLTNLKHDLKNQEMKEQIKKIQSEITDAELLHTKEMDLKKILMAKIEKIDCLVDDSCCLTSAENRGMDKLNKTIEFYKNYSKDMVKYELLKSKINDNINESYRNKCDEIEKLENTPMHGGNCPSCGEYIQIIKNQFKLGKIDDAQNCIDERRLKKIKSALLVEKNDICKKVYDNESIQTQIKEIEEKYQEIKDSAESANEKYKYYTMQKKERNDYESKLNNTKEREIEQKILKNKTEIEKLISRTSGNIDNSLDNSLEKIQTMIETVQKNIYKKEMLDGEKNKTQDLITNIEKKIKRLERNSPEVLTSIEEVKNKIEENAVREKKLDKKIENMKSKKNKTDQYEIEKKRIEQCACDKKNKIQEMKKDYLRTYLKFKEKEELQSEIDELNKKIKENIQSRDLNQNIKKEIGKWNENNIILNKNRDRAREMEVCKNTEKECIQYCIAINIFKNKLIETESILLSQLITTINTYANIYLDGFFQDQIITSELSAYKKIKKGSKNQINLIIYYKGEECDLSNLSGGEQSRIILAYTMALSELLNPPFIMLDEAMASLDQDTTDMVCKTIKYNCKNKIIILVAHQVVQGHFDNIIELI
jgi:DNA repair exonuclease SbcCD ATPase subunit